MQPAIQKKYNIKYQDSGKPVLVFAHGYGCDQSMWRFVAPAFEEKYDVLLFDYVGSGNSDIKEYNPSKYNTLYAYAEDVLEIITYLNKSEVIFVGHSVSAIIGILAAKMQPQFFQNLVLVSPSPYFINDGAYKGGFSKEDIEEIITTVEDNFIGWTSFVTPVIVGNKERMEFASELEKSFCSMDPVAARQFAKITFSSDHREDLAGIDVPCLIIQCQFDQLAPIEVGDFMHEKLTSSQLVVIEEWGHCPHLTSPGKVIASIDQFLQAHQ
ncbi:alpha/beta fold hydrolase [Cecembia lonarensis]|uniref:Sigma factor sigB regulation protein rsbQ n=1 Tax=Cecembia lonarensis (strain CCUG 58316 / KCTC 22772 / LW9) TaxID=1225176 RepID=K1L4Z3_CECL9|nr:alpha/beta hydrolase [Cecembia lonarensis]EKB49801.1 Sigma factor sigB regulation protein rsbQ [Cecembia lonarensis LW9]